MSILAKKLVLSKDKILMFPNANKHPFLSNINNWSVIKLHYTNSEGDSKSVILKDDSEEIFLSTIKAVYFDDSDSPDDYQLKTIQISDSEGNALKLKRTELATFAEDLDINTATISDDEWIETASE